MLLALSRFRSSAPPRVKIIFHVVFPDQIPKLKSTFEETTVRPGKPVTLECVATGDPLPLFAWSLDRFWPLDSRHGRLRVRTSRPDHSSGPSEVVSTLSIGSAEVQDGGSYSCEASNYAGVATHVARLNVYGPVFIRSLSNVTALAGTILEMHCPYGGYPFGHVYWEKGN